MQKYQIRTRKRELVCHSTSSLPSDSLKKKKKSGKYVKLKSTCKAKEAVNVYLNGRQILSAPKAAFLSFSLYFDVYTQESCSVGLESIISVVYFTDKCIFQHVHHSGLCTRTFAISMFVDGFLHLLNAQIKHLTHVYDLMF